MMLWEISLLLEKERIKLKYPFDDWIQKALTAINAELINLDPDIILTYHKLVNFHSDPADKFISAASIFENIPLLTFEGDDNYSWTNPQFFSSGHFSKDLTEDYPELELEDIKAALLYAAKLVEEEKVYNIGA